ncbi:UV-B-induced protein, chloroplastic [Quillaja saponaria]|uniref:UV-B-induced protein, chloroplastic n=1 Tax=Quillaja saponaria TaxID=32244 RepID=A0AAD7L362_QUISA|nr:UV-B-induced protein, chloroplastic [Quillaja saponaria]
MENCLSHPKTLTLPSPPSSSSKPQLTHNFSPKPTFRFNNPLLIKPAKGGLCCRRRPLSVIASAGASHCEFSSLNSPLEPRSLAGKFLSNVLQNHRQLFHIAVTEELKLLADDREAAVTRMVLSTDSDEACLHRRIAQLKEHQCEIAVEDVMYMLIFYKFSEIKVPLVPRLSRCVYNGRLEIWPSKDWALESIHSLEVLEMVREHIYAVIGLRANSSVTDGWATTKIGQSLVGQIYVASILYGYFLKSVSLRHHLEKSLSFTDHDLQLGHRTQFHLQDMSTYGFTNLLFGCFSNKQSIVQGPTSQEGKFEGLRCYVMGFHPESLQGCAKLRSKEAVKLVESHSCALFGEGESGSFESDDFILTSFSSLKRLILEAVAFGSFLWETEDYINNVYKLKEN